MRRVTRLCGSVRLHVLTAAMPSLARDGNRAADAPPVTNDLFTGEPNATNCIGHVEAGRLRKQGPALMVNIHWCSRPHCADVASCGSYSRGVRASTGRTDPVREVQRQERCSAGNDRRPRPTAAGRAAEDEVDVQRSAWPRRARRAWRGSAPDSSRCRATSPRVCLAMWLTTLRPPAVSRSTRTATVRSPRPAGLPAA